MSIIRNHGFIVFECDDCGETLETGVKEFYLAPEAAKQEGWDISKANGEWIHRCPECYAEYMKPQNDFEV